MGRVAMVSVSSLIPDELMRAVARWLSGARPGFVVGALPRDEDEVELFVDWDDPRHHGGEHFVGDAEECRSRRIDLRGPTDLDPGPLAMDERVEDGSEVHELTFAR